MTAMTAMTAHGSLPEFDVIIVGGGPAGSTAANLLAQDGWRVLVLEREAFPRFHVGESLLPGQIPLYRRLGVELDDCEYLCKRGAEFIDEASGDHATFLFCDGLPGTPAHAWQVERSKFDHMLLSLARAAGATVHERECCEKVELDSAGVLVVSNRTSYRARYFVDATGQSAFLARTRRTIEPYHGFGRAAAFCHFSGVCERVQRDIEPQGNIKVLMLEDGWAWAIPLRKDKLSIGVVKARGVVNESALLQVVRSSPLLQQLLSGTTRGPIQQIGNYSFRNASSHGTRFACVGDAACFLDPVFSSGVTLAMVGASLVTDTLTRALADECEDAPELMSDVSSDMQRAYQCFTSLIHRFYHRKIVHNLFFSPDPDPLMRRGLISLLAGDVWRTDNPFHDLLLRAR